MTERKNLVTMNGTALTLLGNPVEVGHQAPSFVAIGNNMAPVDFASFRGQVVILSAVPSLDTPVCDTETRKFNAAAAKLGSQVKIITISMDLPFAQARWCGAAGIDQVVTVSDYKDRSFGQAYGVLIKEIGLLARAVFVIDQQGVVRHIELVKEIASEPNYDQIIAAAKALL